MSIPKTNRIKLKRKHWFKLTEHIPANIILETWENNLWMCKLNGKIVYKEHMIDKSINPKDKYLWRWWFNFIKANTLNESIDKLNSKFLSKVKKKDIPPTIKFLKNKFTQVHNTLVKKMMMARPS